MSETHDKSVPADRSSRFARKFHWIVFVVFLLNVLLVAPAFFPAMGDINPWDDATYINSGQDLVHGIIPMFTMNPLVAGMYALTYLPVHASPYWLIHSCSLARMMAFSLIWLSAYLVAVQLTELATPFIIVALLVISPVLVRLLDNGSNELFTAMAGFTLWQFLLFLRTRNVKHLWLTSLFLGLAALSRNEGPILFLIYLCLTIVACVRWGILRKGLVAYVIPFTMLVGGYVFLYGLRTGHYELGNKARSYLAFEQGQGMAYVELYATKAHYVEGGLEAQRLYGTAEENHYSVITAIRRNPSAYIRRTVHLAKHAVQDTAYEYGQYFGLLCFAFALRGVLELVRRKSFMLLATLLLSSGYGVLYVLLCYQSTHLLMPFLTLFTLAAVGVSAMLLNSEGQRERYLWTTILLAIAAIAAVKCTTPNMLGATLAILLGLWIVWLVADFYHGVGNRVVVAHLLLLLVALLVRFEFPYAKTRVLGSAPDEQAALFLRDHFKPDTHVGAWAPGTIWLAKMSHVEMGGALRSMKSGQDLADWMGSNDVAAIYVDQSLRQYESDLWGLVRDQIGKELKVAFTDDQNEVELLVPVDKH